MTYFVIKYGERLDEWISRLYFKLKHSRNIDTKTKIEAELSWLRYIISGLRAGQNPKTILNLYLNEPFATKVEKIHSLEIIQNDKPTNQIAKILRLSIEYGVSCTQNLKFIERMKNKQIQILQKIDSQTALARAQSIIACIIPILISISFYLIDPQMMREAFIHQYSWILAVIALGLNTLCFFWLNKIVKTSINAETETQADVEDNFPKFIIAFTSMISAGGDIDSSLKASLVSIPKTSCLHRKNQNNTLPAEALTIHSIIDRSNKFGAPVKEPLLDLLEDIQEKTLQRYEKAVQLLGLKILFPIFICSMPANLISVLLPVIPLLLEF